MNAPRMLMFAMLTTGLLAGCSTTAPGVLGTDRSGVRAAATALPALEPARIAVKAVNAHQVEIVGRLGAASGTGVWVSLGALPEPGPGYAAKVASDGSFTLELHAHPGDVLTLWTFVDQGEERRYSRPLSLQVPSL